MTAMTSQLRRFLHTYVSRRSPWGPPWWIYGVAFGALNLTRQAVILTMTPEISQPVRIASWVATALGVIVVINAGAAAVRRWGTAAPGGPTLLPLWPLRRHHDRS